MTKGVCMWKELSHKQIKNYITNIFLAKIQKKPVFTPIFFTHYITLKCNFNCSYCGFTRKNSSQKLKKELNTKEILKLINIIKKEINWIYFTGGEPLIRKDIIKICKECKNRGFSSISVNTNMSLIHKKMKLLNYITNLVASYDTNDDKKNSKLWGVSVYVAKQVRKNIITCAKLQKQKGFLLTINCVITPDTISDVREVMEFCFKNDIRFAPAPMEVSEGKVNNKLKNNVEYKNLIRDIIKAKKQGKPVFGSYCYLNTILDFKSFECQPMLVPHTYPNGDFFYPCQNLAKIGGNLLKEGDYKKLLKKGIKKFGPIPKCKDKCYKACYIYPPKLVNNPFVFLQEFKGISN